MATVKHFLQPEEAQYIVATAAFPQFVRVDGTNFPVSGLAYDGAGSTEEKAYWRLKASNYGSGTLTLVIRWYANATANAVVWGTRIAAVTPSDAGSLEAESFDTQQTVVSNVLGTTAKRLNEASITISNTDSIAADDEVYIEISRLPANASDTLTSDATLTEAELQYSDT